MEDESWWYYHLMMATCALYLSMLLTGWSTEPAYIDGVPTAVGEGHFRDTSETLPRHFRDTSETPPRRPRRLGRRLQPRCPACVIRHDRHVRRGVLLGRAALLLGQGCGAPRSGCSRCTRGDRRLREVGRVAVDLLAALLVDAARAVLAARPPRLWHRVRLLASGRKRAARSGFRARLRGGGGEDGREGVLSGRGS